MGMTNLELYKPRGIFYRVSDIDAERVSWHKWYKYRGNRFISGTAGGSVTISLARYIMQDVDPRLKDPNLDLTVDHIDRLWVHNERENLRVATPLQNAQNRGKQANAFSEYKGVVWYRKMNCWVARIMINGISLYLGCFNNEIEAAKAYDRAARKWFKEFAVFNFPEEK